MHKSPSGFSEKAIRGMTVQEIRSHVERLASDIHASNFTLGGLVRRVRDEGLWRTWGGNTYPSFDDWCWAILGFKESKAEGLARIYMTIQGAKVTGGVKKKLVDLGWTKLRHLSRVIDEDNAEEWLGRASTLSARALDAEVRIAVGKQAGKGESFGGSDAGEESKPRLKLEAFFDDEEDFRFVNRVLAIMERRTKTKSNGRLFGMMASAYLAQHNRDDEGGLPAELEDHIRALERMYGVELEVKTPKAQPVKAAKRGRKKGVRKAKK